MIRLFKNLYGNDSDPSNNLCLTNVSMDKCIRNCFRWYVSSGMNCVCSFVLNSHKCQLNAVGMRYLRSVCCKIRRERLEKEWMLNKCGLRTRVSDQCDKNLLRWFGHLERRHED